MKSTRRTGSAVLTLVVIALLGVVALAGRSASELPAYRHGALTVALLDALCGRENAYRKSNGRITQTLLTAWFEYRIPELTQDRQKPAKIDGTNEAIEVVAVTPTQ